MSQVIASANDFNMDMLLGIGRNSTPMIENVKDLGEFEVDGNVVRRVDNNNLGTHSLVFPLTHNGQTISKFAILRGNASLNAPKYKVYVGMLLQDVTDKNGNLYRNAEGKEVGQKGSLNFYAESIGGDPRPANPTPNKMGDQPVF